MGGLRKLFRRRRRDNEAERALRYLWRSFEHSTEQEAPPKIDLADVLVLQFGKVASTSLQAGLRAAGFNAFHSHGLSEDTLGFQQRDLLRSPARASITSVMFRRLIRQSAIRLLLNWYKLHKAKDGRGLKVVTLTRDPVTRFRSVLMQRYAADPSPVLAWHGMRTPASPAASFETALGELLREVMTQVVAARPAADCARANAEARSLLDAAAADQYLARREAQRLLNCLDWFDREILHLFGFDVLAAPDFAEQGFARFQNDFAELLVLRYETLDQLLPEVARFLGCADFRLPRLNVSEEKRSSVEVECVFRDALETPLGIAFARELRGTPYARACGYGS